MPKKSGERMGSTGTPSRVLIVDDHPVVRHGLEQLIASEPGLEVCGGAAGAAEALSLIEKTQPNLVVIDVSLQDGSGIDLIKDIKARYKHIRMLVSSMHDEMLFAERCLRAGAMGYINKQEATEKIVDAIRQILEGRIYLSSRAADRLLQYMVDIDQEPSKSPFERLSDRELEVFTLIGEGLSTRQIAERLKLSVKTIETHRDSIKRKLNLESSVELTRSAVQWVLEQS
jgi:DNA-binding NarL/FixJ family response regulator